ncbi:MAG: RNA pseudouridine synthase [Treponema sp.]|jgi:23S rRNA pseudouridine1911/1915/1917 synthase|nr:RNA pseudouridine synthase [Treponema sp.]
MKAEPEIVGETSSFIVAYKPPRMHSAPLGRDRDGSSAFKTLLDCVAEIHPEVRSVRGWKPVEGGLVHRLDYETSGLLLVARTQAAMDALRGQQEQNLIVKEYAAVSAGRGETLPGFPPCMFTAPPDKPVVVESAFRPYGKGRKAVRPVLPQPGLPLYQTEIVSCSESVSCSETDSVPGRVFRLRISRGYRHQIRCHLAWTGRPIVNDFLYGGVVVESAAVNAVPVLALSAKAISFSDPETGRRVRYSLAF